VADAPGLFSIDGRLDRRRYAWRAGLSWGWIVYYAFYDTVTRGPGGPIHLVSTPMVIGWFTAVWILFSASTQRVQDIGWGPWAVAIPVGLAIGTGKIERLFGTRLALDIGNLVGGAMLTVFILIAALKRGQAGANKWGPDPRQDLPQL
jgi:uncharacterized membrane protein YhaH (DUF805 family)